MSRVRPGPGGGLAAAHFTELLSRELTAFILRLCVRGGGGSELTLAGVAISSMSLTFQVASGTHGPAYSDAAVARVRHFSAWSVCVVRHAAPLSVHNLPMIDADGTGRGKSAPSSARTPTAPPASGGLGLVWGGWMLRQSQWMLVLCFTITDRPQARTYVTSGNGASRDQCSGNLAFCDVGFSQQLRHEHRMRTDSRT